MINFDSITFIDKYLNNNCDHYGRLPQALIQVRQAIHSLRSGVSAVRWFNTR